MNWGQFYKTFLHVFSACTYYIYNNSVEANPTLEECTHPSSKKWRGLNKKIT
jgi:hypothetical protein